MVSFSSQDFGDVSDFQASRSGPPAALVRSPVFAFRGHRPSLHGGLAALPWTTHDLLPVSLCSPRPLGRVLRNQQPLRGLCSGHQDSKMASVVPVKEKKLMDVKLGELPSWILMRDFTPKGIAGAFQRGYYRYYNKYVNVKKGGVAGVSMVLAAYVLFSYCLSYKELKHERRRKYH
ncbi:ATP synthase subunit f, mitochondrial [Tupaia chinensis]|uniref:ATP synthase subunit f, mitochondrial n=1 Tax=Tupaia chinensis TaxID=246437 RepID=UPI0007045F45|nr:ATP synthase subunit f, mitochondrial [Tupaia chinensis]